jgi:DNA (cytosine-5)-methyltransferase 1
MNTITTSLTNDHLLISPQSLYNKCNQEVIQIKQSLEGKVFELRNDEGLREFQGDVCGTIRTIGNGGDKHTMQHQQIRRLTPRECFRLMDFPDTFTWNVSDSQAYKQAGNSIVVNVLFKIIKNLNL